MNGTMTKGDKIFNIVNDIIEPHPVKRTEKKYKVFPGSIPNFV